MQQLRYEAGTAPTRTLCCGRRSRRCRRCEIRGSVAGYLRSGAAGDPPGAWLYCCRAELQSSAEPLCPAPGGSGRALPRGVVAAAAGPGVRLPLKRRGELPPARTRQGTDGVRTRDLRFTRPTPYHLATAPALRASPDAFLSLAPLPHARPRPALARAWAAACRGRAALRR
ncbi:unnamed protein product [Coccothraustes coccothraustes]